MRLALVLPLVLLAACQTEEMPNADSAQQPDPLAGDAPDSSATERVVAGGSCYLVATESVVLYQRPNTESSQFGVLAAGDSAFVGSEAVGWIGIEPGTAQAPNVGPFRYRWAEPGGPYELRGPACDALPNAPLLPANVCFFMAGAETPVFAQPEAGADTLSTFEPQAYARALSRNDGDWLEIELTDGARGWVRPNDINVNGADCADL